MMATTMQATVDAASVARIASMRSNDPVFMIYVLPKPAAGCFGLQISIAIRKSTDICNLEQQPYAKAKSRGKSGAYQESPDRGRAQRDHQEGFCPGLGSRHCGRGGVLAGRVLFEFSGQGSDPAGVGAAATVRRTHQDRSCAEPGGGRCRQGNGR